MKIRLSTLAAVTALVGTWALAQGTDELRVYSSNGVRIVLQEHGLEPIQ